MAMRILFVCMGNICRSPTAEGVALHYIKNNKLEDKFEVDSAGTHAYHVGEAPDRRAQRAALRRGVDLARLRARRVSESDFEAFDLILAMDRENLAMLKAMAPPEHFGKLALLMQHARGHYPDEVPDPYYGGEDGFERVLDMVQDAIEGLMSPATSK